MMMMMAISRPLLMRGRVLKLAKYASVSVITTGRSLMMLGVMVGLLDLPIVWSNVVATAVATVPSFELKRR